MKKRIKETLVIVFMILSSMTGLFPSACNLNRSSPIEPLSEKEAPAMKNPAFVRTVQENGKTWFARGDERFLSLGVNCVLPADGSKPSDGRRYNALPKHQNNLDAWAQTAAERLKSWNFNTVAGWSEEVLYEKTPMLHTRVLWLGPWGKNDGRLTDVFSPDYEEAVDREARKTVAPHATNEYLIGYFANNELPWYGERGWPTSPRVSLITSYMLLPTQSPGKQRLMKFFRDYYNNDFAAFNAEWKTGAESFEDLQGRQYILSGARTSAKAVAAWAGIVAERYFQLCAETIRRYDPNHLFLGVRFAGRAQESVMAACGKYADVISINSYSKSGEPDLPLLKAVAALTGKPILITEFSWRAEENASECPNTHGADVTVATQQNRADAFSRYATQVLEQPFILGYHWFQLFDQPPAGRFDGEDSNYGLLDIYDQPYDELLSVITDINGRAGEIHAQSKVTPQPVDPNILADFRETTLRGANEPLAQPILFTDASTRFITWGDADAGGKIDAQKNDDGTLTLHIHPAGWGCGITFFPRDALPKNPDASVSLLGADRFVVDLQCTSPILVGPSLSESGCGPVSSQTFSGYGGADGEGYTGVGREIQPGEGPYTLPLKEMGLNTGYGNQRGNKIVDMQAVESLQLFFPPNQPPTTLTFRSLSLQ
ncbi:MAG: hypothetical protein PHG65_12950 [Kiritimatiellae bacterium]|nr:hypothetical protein [Kiritimatiellia bacterium]